MIDLYFAFEIHSSDAKLNHKLSISTYNNFLFCASVDPVRSSSPPFSHRPLCIFSGIILCSGAIYLFGHEIVFYWPVIYSAYTCCYIFYTTKTCLYCILMCMHHCFVRQRSMPHLTWPSDVMCFIQDVYLTVPHAYMYCNKSSK